MPPKGHTVGASPPPPRTGAAGRTTLLLPLSLEKPLCQSLERRKELSHFYFCFFCIFVYITLFLHDLFSNENSKITSRSFQIGRQNK